MRGFKGVAARGRRRIRRGAVIFAKPEHFAEDTNPDGAGICGTIHIQSVF